MNNNNSNNENKQRNTQSQPLSQKELEKKQNHEASKDVAHTVGKGAATYLGGAVGNKLYDVASKTKLGQGIEKGVGKVLESSPVAKTAMKALHKSGATKIANNAIDAVGGKKTTLNNGMSNINKGFKSTNKSLGISPQNNMAFSNRGNTTVNTSGRQNEEPDFENMTEEEKENYVRQKELEEIQQKKEEKAKRNDKIKSFIKFLIKNPQIAFFLGIAIFISFILIILIYMIAADIDLVGNRGVSYETADSVSGYCNQIILIKEHDEYKGDPVAHIDDVDLEETFKLNNKMVKRWSYQTINLEDYIKGVLQAETSIIKDKKTYEVASIVARTYAVEITSKKCYTWDNTNKREQYKNPQNYISGNIDSDISSAVDTTNGLIAYDKDSIIDMSQNNYYDYFCYSKITNTKNEDKSYYNMVQENEEESLLISVDWTKDSNNVAEGDAKKWNYSGKYNGGIYTNDCQEDGLSLYGAKYLLNKKSDPYDTIRVLMYYYTYDLELKRLATSISINNNCYWWPTTSTTITSFFGPRTAPIAGASTNHGALDIGVPRNSEVYAVTGGIVTKVIMGCNEGNLGCGGGYGNYIIINHGNGIESLYAHLNSVKVSIGENVTQGQVIALSGSTGRSTGPHLHFEIRLNGTKVDPLNYISPNNTKPSCTIGGGNVVIGSSNEQTVCKTLAANGFTPSAIAGIMANLASESGFNPNAFNSSGGGQGAYGIAQWRGNRQTSLKALANYDTLEVQLQYLINEITTGSEKAAGNAYMSAMNTGADANSMTYNWCYNYERPGKDDSEKSNACNNRVSANSGRIQSYYNYAQNGCN